MGKSTTIRVPVEFRNLVRTLAEKRGVPQWKILHESVVHYRLAYLSHFQANTKNLNKASWYAYKLSASVGAFRYAPTDENKELLMRTIEQLEQRLGVNGEMLKRAVEDYYKTQRKKYKIALNDAAKELVAQVIVKILGVEEKKKEEGRKEK